MHVQGSLLKLAAAPGRRPCGGSPSWARCHPKRCAAPALACRLADRVRGRSLGAQQHHRGVGIESQRGPPRLRALAGQARPAPGQRGPAAGTG